MFANGHHNTLDLESLKMFEQKELSQLRGGTGPNDDFPPDEPPPSV